MKINRKEIMIIGTTAFNSGISRVACLDKNIMALIGQGYNAVKVMKLWYKGWDSANLNTSIK